MICPTKKNPVESDTLLETRKRGGVYQSPVRNYPRENKCVLLRAGKVVTTIKVWAHVPLSRTPTATYTPSVEGEGCDRERDGEASSVSSVIQSANKELETCGQGVEMMTLEINYTG